MRILLADTETTDVDAKAEICEVAFIEVDQNLGEVYRFSSLVKPVGPISPAASAKSGITNKMVEHAPAIEAILAPFLERNYFEDVFLIAHNLKFDKRMLEPHWNITGGLCTLRAAMHWLPDSPNHQLQTLRYHLEIEVDAKAHSALDDIVVMKKVLEKMIEKSGLGSFQAFAEGEAKFRRIWTMPWGQHRGVSLRSIPGGYVGWLLKLPDLDPELRWSLENRFKEDAG